MKRDPTLVMFILTMLSVKVQVTLQQARVVYQIIVNTVSCLINKGLCIKLMLLVIVSLLSVLRVAAQTSKELLLAIQQSKPDTNRDQALQHYQKIIEIGISKHLNEELKDESIKFMQSTVQQSMLERAILQRNITMGGLVLLLAISGITYNGYRHKQRSNLQLQAKQQQINTQNTVLQNLVSEKDWLLKEVHHRVKNNLYTVICLLESQASYLENDALKAIESSQHRIYAMSLIHQKLYQSDDIKTIDMSDYIPELVQTLEDSFDSSNQIQFKLKIDSINFSPSHAIPLGLIINEAVTNSIKYAFPNNRKGEISISMVYNGDRIKLELADNGIGISQVDPAMESVSFGMELMKGLSEDMDADISFEDDNGTRITIIFKPDALNDADSLLKAAETKEVYLYEYQDTYC